MNNAKVFERMDVKKAKQEFGRQYEYVMMLLRQMGKEVSCKSLLRCPVEGNNKDEYVRKVDDFIFFK